MTNPPPPLNLSDAELELAGQLLTTFLRDYERTISMQDGAAPADPASADPAPASSRLAIVPDVDRSVLDTLAHEPFPDDGTGVEPLFRTIVDRVVPNSTAVAHPRFLAYVLGPPTGIAPYADAIAAALNQNCNFWQLSPAASVIERSVVDWLCGLFGFPETAGGLFTDGGSTATLTALAAAMNDHRAEFRSAGLQGGASPLVLYTSEQAHRAIEKDAVILGLGLDNVRKIPVDADLRMRADLLQSAIRRDREAGQTPFCVVATAGTVNTGALDPIDDIADICHDEDLWLHVDGAYGALFVLSEQKRAALLPCGRADSIALDPHKLLFAPLEAGCLVVRDREKLRGAFAFSSSYLTAADDPVMVDFMDYGPQLSRGFKAFKVWCSLRAFGVAAFRAALDRTLELAHYLGERIESSPALELMAPVNLTAVCFRIRDTDDDAHRALLAALAADGTALLGPVSINGRLGLRACVTNYRTTRADIDLIVDRIQPTPDG